MGAGIRINERGTQREVDEKHTERGEKRDRKYENGQNPIKRKEKESEVVSLAGYGEG